MPRPTLRIDAEHSARLLTGKSVTIKVPPNTKELTLVCDLPRANGSGFDLEFTKMIDVFFNGRKA